MVWLTCVSSFVDMPVALTPLCGVFYQAEGGKTQDLTRTVEAAQDERAEKATREEVLLLTRTVKLLRAQLSDSLSRQAREELDRTLPPLPSVRKPKIHILTQYTEAQNMAVALQRGVHVG